MKRCCYTRALQCGRLVAGGRGVDWSGMKIKREGENKRGRLGTYPFVLRKLVIAKVGTKNPELGIYSECSSPVTGGAIRYLSLGLGHGEVPCVPVPKKGAKLFLAS